MSRLLHFHPGIRYVVQYVIPVNNPEDNVIAIRRKTVVIFEVPINLPDLHNLGYSQFVDLVERRERLALLAEPNKSVDDEVQIPVEIGNANNPALRGGKRDRKRNSPDRDPDSNAA